MNNTPCSRQCLSFPIQHTTIIATKCFSGQHPHPKCSKTWSEINYFISPSKRRQFYNSENNPARTITVTPLLSHHCSLLPSNTQQSSPQTKFYLSGQPASTSRMLQTSPCRPKQGCVYVSLSPSLWPTHTSKMHKTSSKKAKTSHETTTTTILIPDNKSQVLSHQWSVLLSYQTQNHHHQTKKKQTTSLFLSPTSSIPIL